MKHLLIIICFFLYAGNSFSQNEPSQDIITYYFIRHAEKERSNPSEKNAHLTDEGHKRAENWSVILQEVTFDAVYATDYHRTRETAQPTALKNQLPVLTYNAKASYDDLFRTNTKGKTVLIVGHSNTIPNFVNAVIGKEKYMDIDDAINGNLYIVTIANGFITDMMLIIN